MKDQSPQHPLRRLKSSIRELQRRHRDRHRPTGFGFVFADRIDYLDPARWDSIADRGTVFLRRDLLRVIGQHGPSNIQPRYAVIFQEDRPVATLVAQLVNVRREHFNPKPNTNKTRSSPGLLKRVLAPAWRGPTAKLIERLLFG